MKTNKIQAQRGGATKAFVLEKRRRETKGREIKQRVQKARAKCSFSYSTNI
jgi:hypothetical protein